MRDWRKFELLIAAIEKTLLPLGAEIKSPDHLPDLVTGQKREVDASIRFKVGSTPILITVECRKRDSPQDVTWIEQLATKKESIGASTTVAVSSEGFTKAAEELAGRKGIQTRILTETTGSDAAKWVSEIQIALDLLQWRFVKIQANFDAGPGLDEALTFINGNIDKDDMNRPGFRGGPLG
ncbi:restriction endonuclease [Polaromonas eurypsychrophila]|uniref:Restriction endonuclease type IV Mrr domain-containing protein n=1 Tax=Polaromonas eurypsychrophila TaxID=1614635 RepID=A0A916WMA9_9BURK|nr:restriction endonuclease [Polaromonas eurypsychrophila]GGB13972.1 hypothetical protein GCM10011496_38670 [Polaromonas eurypsychrophila]